MENVKTQGKKQGKRLWYVMAVILVNLAAIFLIAKRERIYVNDRLATRSEEAMAGVESVMEDYVHSFRLFSHMMSEEIEEHPDPDDIWNYLKKTDAKMLAIEGDTFDGLYMYYKGRYLYSWDTPYSQYEDTGYVATERPWYRDAQAGGGEIVFTPPYMSYANHYILSTISQLQPDGETVFAYDIRMGDIQQLVSSMHRYEGEQILLFDSNGTVIGSTDENYLGGSLYATQEEQEAVLSETLAAYESAAGEEKAKLEEQIQSATVFGEFCRNFDRGLAKLLTNYGVTQRIKVGNRSYYGCLKKGDMYHTILLVPVQSMLWDTAQIWLIPLLLMEILLIYGAGRVSKGIKNRELRDAYVELGQTQRRLEIALAAAQKAAAVDHLTGMMNEKSYRDNVIKMMDNMDSEENGILIMLDGDHFKAVNDTYGHMVGDEVIKLTAQMIIGRIRTVDLASRLHGDEFSIFVTNTKDYSVAKRIVEDINHTLAAEAARRNMPSITLSAGAVIACHGNSYDELVKQADAALYQAKETHDGAFEQAAR